jgi:predicted 3-demethylubiquinone-9 3-methyltransferase (glyoxalase superfamily)
MQKIVPCLWFDNNAEEAVNFYVSVFKDAKILNTARYPKAAAEGAQMPEGMVMTVVFELLGQRYLALNGGPVFNFTPAISFMVNCETQEELDEYWDKLSAGGEIIECGWLKDKFGMSGQIVPAVLGEMMEKGNPEQQDRVMKALMQMKKLDIAVLKRAYENR